MNSLISICIPTYQRPQLLHQAIQSCLCQTYQNIEIVICDDSKNDESEVMVQSIGKPGIIKYHRNRPSLGQAGNVNRLFDLAQGDRFVLLHDDDLLMPTAIQEMLACWEVEPNLTACFGKQYMISMQGDILEEQSRKLNEDYYRTKEYAGLQSSALWSALVGQFPNDGYMALTAIAKQVRYRATSNVGDACDFDFGLQLASSYEKFFFLNQFTAMYRLTNISVSRASNYSNLSYQLIKSLQVPDELKTFQGKRLQEYASPAINKWLALGNRYEAHQIYISKYYPWVKRLSPTGLIQAFLLICPINFSVASIKLLKQLKLIKTVNTAC